jgi:hypothetical protein
VFQHDCASFSSPGEHDHVRCSGRIGLKQIMHSGNGGLESENVSMDVRSSPAGTLLRLRCGFGPLVGVDASGLDALSAGFDRRHCPDCPDAGGFTSWVREVTARPLGRQFRILDGVRADAGKRPADAVRSDCGRRVAVSGTEVTVVERGACGSSAFEPLGLCRRR